MKTYEKIADGLVANGIRFWSNDNISEHITDRDKTLLIEESAIEFEKVLRSLLIDIDTDPNAKGTAKRLAKMYWLELFEGRYNKSPDVTAFPNDGDGMYDGMLVVRADIKSICSHHHKDVLGTCYIGIIPSENVIGLSKYIRIAQWHARRGTLQEELTTRIARSISEITKSPDVGVYIESSHGCVSCRGVNQNNSTTQTTVLLGEFKHNIKTKEEFQHNVQMQKMGER